MIPQQSVFWPYDLLSKHPDFEKARILTWGYNSHVVVDFFGTSDKQNISQHGNNLMVALQQERKRDVGLEIRSKAILLIYSSHPDRYSL